MAELQKKRAPTKTEKEGIFSVRQKGRCNYCGKKPVSMTGMHFDHIVRPQDWKSNDDVNDVSNIQCLCNDCHLHKTSVERNGYSDYEIREIYKLGSNPMKAPTRQLFSNPTKYYHEIRFVRNSSTTSKSSTRKPTKKKTVAKKSTRKKAKEPSVWEDFFGFTEEKKPAKKKTVAKKSTRKKAKEPDVWEEFFGFTEKKKPAKKKVSSRKTTKKKSVRKKPAKRNSLEKELDYWFG